MAASWYPFFCSGVSVWIKIVAESSNQGSIACGRPTNWHKANLHAEKHSINSNSGWLSRLKPLFQVAIFGYCLDVCLVLLLLSQTCPTHPERQAWLRLKLNTKCSIHVSVGQLDPCSSQAACVSSKNLFYNFDNRRSMENLSGMRSEASWPTFCIDDKSEYTLAKASHASQSKPSQTTFVISHWSQVRNFARILAM